MGSRIFYKGEEMSNWIKQEFEVVDKPDEGEQVQYAVLHILQLRKFGIDIEDVKFFMREKEE